MFAIAVMDGVTELARARPRVVLETTAAIFGLNIFLQASAALLFCWRGLHQALTAGLCSGNRNLGLLLAAMADRASSDLLIVIAVASSRSTSCRCCSAGCTAASAWARSKEDNDHAE
ncbi:MAG: hypothetical protein HC871_10200 [Rhizobiales bacterium]|nr:hypothetical protein [Hyphomicrobiales bacterium]